ncbi:serine/threonine-protein kinase RsbW [Fodinibius salinus]|uniref:Serine/threonine-protein kinase RsbW n=1 Tax=Fodinibius salinus TaxID=860790 RepID=A0A5D3YKB0_9BACT|nr:ATP-binding protein [Fodinibius salinus]TYP93396.1 serine/threonine-protein kinase RsbW [Fodinibius salinus]
MSKPIATYNKSVDASTKHLSEVRDFAGEHASAIGFNEQEIANIRLAVDEAYTNIIKHAYHSDNHKTVDIEIGYDDCEFWISLIDTGNAFDPSNYSKPDVRQKIRQKKRGGVGVYLIKKLMDNVEYHTDGSVNTIRMIKKR